MFLSNRTMHASSLISLLLLSPLLLAGCFLTPRFKIEPATAFPVDKGGPELQKSYLAMKEMFSRFNPDYPVRRISADQLAWDVERNPNTGVLLKRNASVFLGVASIKKPGTCEILVVTFQQDNLGGSSWGDMYVHRYGFFPSPGSYETVGDFERPFPIACPLLEEKSTSKPEVSATPQPAKETKTENETKPKPGGELVLYRRRK